MCGPGCGFSAGYHNTVGSKDGWAPQAFRSSREDKAGSNKYVQQNASDFMDEDERAELNATSLEARDDYDTFGMACQISLAKSTNACEQSYF